MTQSDASSEDWRRLQSSMPDLSALAEIHDDGKIRNLARRLKKLVATHGVILEHTSNIKSKCKEMSDRTDQGRDSVRSHTRKCDGVSEIGARSAPFPIPSFAIFHGVLGIFRPAGGPVLQLPTA